MPALILLITSYSVSGSAMLFGWAKPVPVNFGRLRNPLRDMMWVAAAGPAVNFLMALGWALLLKLAVVLPENIYTLPMGQMAVTGINVNLVLRWCLICCRCRRSAGGSRSACCRNRLAVQFSQLERWGFPILLLLLFTDILGLIMWPFVSMFKRLILILFQLV